MRVIAGEARGRRLAVPRGLKVRPSGARLRESVFGILEHRGAIHGAHVLDLFAGSGALGIEALSRGAEAVVAVEADRQVAETVRANATLCGFAGRHRTIVRRAEKYCEKPGPADVFSLVFLDPPYGKSDIDAILNTLGEGGLLAPQAFVLVEHPTGEGPSDSDRLVLDLRRRFGGSEVSLLQLAAE